MAEKFGGNKFFKKNKMRKRSINCQQSKKRGGPKSNTSAKDSQHPDIVSLLKPEKKTAESVLSTSIAADNYQQKLLMLFLFRVLKCEYSFQLKAATAPVTGAVARGTVAKAATAAIPIPKLSTDIAAKKFENLILIYENHKNIGKIICFPKTKHVCTKITAEHLLNEANNEEDPFNIRKYFAFYHNIKQNPIFKTKNSEFKDFVICTNIAIDENFRSNFTPLLPDEDNMLDIAWGEKSTVVKHKFVRFKENENCPVMRKLIAILKNTLYRNTLAQRLGECVSNKKPIHLSDELFRQYNAVLVEKVIDVENAKFHKSFIDGTVAELNNFRNAFLEAYCGQSMKHVNVAEFWQQMKMKKLKTSRSFGKVNDPNINVELTTGEIKQFVNAIINVIGIAHDAVVNISMETLKCKNIIKDNIEILLRFVLTRKGDKEMDVYYFNSVFFDDTTKLPGNLELLRRKFKSEFDNIKIDRDKYKFHVENVQTSAALPNDFIDDNEIEIFLRKLVFPVDQPNAIELINIIKNELGESFASINKNSVYAKFLVKMLNLIERFVGKTILQCHVKVFFAELKSDILVNIWFNIKDPIRLFTGRKDELNLLHKTLQRTTPKGGMITRIILLNGFGGIGKSELVRKYAKDYSGKYYDNVLWINAENYEVLVESFFNLATDNRLGIPRQFVDRREIDVVVKEIYEFFGNNKSLFVFDNVEQNFDLNKFLPLHSLRADSKRPFIIITSRVRERESGIEIIKLNELKLTDAISFVKSGLGIPMTDKTQDQDIENLGKELQCFPLALQHAIIYIVQHRLTGQIKIAEYLKKYEDEKNDLLECDIFEDNVSDYIKTTFNTWQIAIDEIRMDKELGRLASDILEIMAYFAPENINSNLFLKVAKGDVEKLKLAIQLLVNYSLINVEDNYGVVSVHRMVQEVTRINLKDQNKEKTIAEETFQLLKESYPCVSYRFCNYLRKRQLLPHLVSFSSHMVIWSKKKPEDRHRIEENYFIILLELISDVYSDLGDNRKKKELLEQALQFKMRHFGPDHHEVAKTLENLCEVYRALGDHLKQKELLEQTLTIKNNHYGVDHFEVAITLGNLGIACGDLGDLNKRVELLEQALEIQKKYYESDDHFQVAIQMENLGIAYGDLGEFDKQMEMFKSTLEIKEKLYGPDHIEVAIALGNLAKAYGDVGDHEKKRELLERTLKIKLKHYGPTHFEVSITLVNLGIAYGALGNALKKKNLLEKALKIEEKYYGYDHYQVATILVSLANAYGDLGVYQKKKMLLERVLKIAQMCYDPEHYQIAIILVNLSNAYGCVGEFEKQKELLEWALRIQEKYYGAEHFQVVLTLGNLVDAYGALGETKKQTELLERILKFEEKFYGPDHFQVAITLGKLGIAYGELGDLQKRKDFLEMALSIKNKYYGPDHFEVAIAMLSLGSAYGDLGDHEKQKDFHDRAIQINNKFC